MNRVVIGVVAAILAVAATGCDSSSDETTLIVPDGTVEANAVVDRVVDGDTVDVIIDGREERIRLIGIDTPETKRPNSPVECYGPEASAFTEALLPEGTLLRIERDVVGRDDYGRLLGYLIRVDDGLFVNDEIVRRGFAQPLSIAPNTVHADLFVDAARTAERDDLGLWSACSG
ncbi:thermonuclease family protein [Ilumatobacter nonamiensis]|uniref:thermonuclease family protein n=1 Tax=Ilumatobacter nonamiensis TaxID=467093 RepID=UPI00034B6244|nr:thermonuclease family protein [Ilumatobacter nonamiensis]